MKEEEEVVAPELFLPAGECCWAREEERVEPRSECCTVPSSAAGV